MLYHPCSDTTSESESSNLHRAAVSTCGAIAVSRLLTTVAESIYYESGPLCRTFMADICLFPNQKSGKVCLSSLQGQRLTSAHTNIPSRRTTERQTQKSKRANKSITCINAKNTNTNASASPPPQRQHDQRRTSTGRRCCCGTTDSRQQAQHVVTLSDALVVGSDDQEGQM